MATSNTTLRYKLNLAFEEALALHGDLLCDGCFRPGGPKESKKAPKLSSPVIPSVVGQKILNLWSAEELHNNSLLQGKVNLFSNGTEDFLLSHSYKRVVETSSDKKQSSTLLALLQNKPSDRLGIKTLTEFLHLCGWNAVVGENGVVSISYSRVNDCLEILGTEGMANYCRISYMMDRLLRILHSSDLFPTSEPQRKRMGHSLPFHGKQSKFNNDGDESDGNNSGGDDNNRNNRGDIDQGDDDSNGDGDDSNCSDGDESNGDESGGNDSNCSNGDDSDGDDSNGDDSNGDDSNGDDSNGDDSNGDDSGSNDRGGNDQGDDVQGDGDRGDPLPQYHLSAHTSAKLKDACLIDIHQRNSAFQKLLRYQQALQMGLQVVELSFCFLDKRYKDDKEFMKKLFLLIFGHCGMRRQMLEGIQDLLMFIKDDVDSKDARKKVTVPARFYRD